MTIETNAKSTPPIIPILLGIIAAVLVLLTIMLLSGGGDDPVADTTTSTGVDTTTTTIPPATTTTAGTTTTAPEETTTTSAAFAGDTAPKSNDAIVGDPEAYLTEVRFGEHEEFVRVVFELTGAGEPIWMVAYADPPFTTDGEGGEVPVAGTAFLKIDMTPGARYDQDFTLTYEGDLVLQPDLSPIDQVVFLDDFERVMHWVIGLDAERPFTATLLQDPLRLVIDIAK